MKRWGFFLALMGAMLVTLSLSEQAVEAARQGLALCAHSVVPSLFPFFVLSSLFVASGCSDVPSRLLGGLMYRLFGCSGSGAGAFFLGILGGYPLGARTVGQLYTTGRLTQPESEALLCFCNNAGPAFILGLVGVVVFGDVRIGVWLYLVHVAAATIVGLLCGRTKGGGADRHVPPSAPPPFFVALVESIASAGAAMVQISAFVVFFYTALQLLTTLTGVSHPLALGIIELTRGITALNGGRSAFILASALLGWGGISVHCQTAAVLSATPLRLRRYLCAKALHALIAAALAWAISPLLF
jgi:sporulation integral membrane protein YlbJ